MLYACIGTSIMAVMDSLSNHDQVSLWKFNHEVQRVFPLTTLGDSKTRQALNQSVMRNTECDGGTAFYDAIMDISMELKLIAPQLGEREPCLVVLVDGEDAHSRASYKHAANALKGAAKSILGHSPNKLRFIMITVGDLDNENQIKHIVNSVNDDNSTQLNGIHISTSSGNVTEDITDAFQKVGELLEANFSNINTYDMITWRPPNPLTLHEKAALLGWTPGGSHRFT